MKDQYCQNFAIFINFAKHLPQIRQKLAIFLSSIWQPWCHLRNKTRLRSDTVDKIKIAGIFTKRIWQP